MSLKITQEMKFLKYFNHKNIIKLFEVLDTYSDIFAVMEYVKTGDLFDFILRNGKLSEPFAKHLFTQIIAAVSYIHRCQVCHRDLKPENILIDD